jgi:thiol-disulfide isomerase/thioredoxin
MVRLAVFFLLVSFFATAQSRVAEGKIVDADTGEPVPFASVGLLGTNRGTSSNLNGQFSLSVHEDSFTIRISCLGYETQEVGSSIAERVLIVQLKPSATQLREVVVFNKAVNARRVVRKAFSAIRDNYNDKPFMESFFYRHYCKDDSVYGRLIEASVDVWKRNGYKTMQGAAGEKEEIRVTQLRRTFDNTATAQGHVPIAINSILQSDIAGYQTRLPSEHLSFFADISNVKTDMEHYTFTFEGITTYDGKEVYEIAYLFREDSLLTTQGYIPRPRSAGSLYITTQEFAFIKTIETKWWGRDTVTTTAYYTPFKGRYYPYHFIKDGKSTASDNSTHWFHVELMASEILTSGYPQFYGKEPGKYELLRIPYDSAYWSTNTILKTTPLEDEIIRDLGSGVSLNDQFKKYQQVERNRIESGNGDDKFDWYKNDSKGKRVLYVGFWSSECMLCIQQIDHARRLMREYKDKLSVVLLSIDADEQRWKKAISRYNLNADGFVNYRIGDKSATAQAYELTTIPRFVLIDKEGATVNVNAKPPGDAQVKAAIEALIRGSEQ